ncbi:MAG: bifunctional 2-C-methyl-D-erythritol 4-phosphate cytidylyltransferase/2-C-methyl-D-erythritol 2,4-cyclodiphosphate synthase [Proteobacteria bacterium]|nr:bifunctional 2-C-methyl-D-erythritol 4-phosphate cytidylyltransferase/2-C-methyl-D-erythritol 2,4-cyclodiphosphate synthase [Pseudomonadota bacterium]
MFAAAIILAAGRGERAGGDRPKQYRDIGGKPVLRRAAQAFLGHPGIARVQVVFHPGDQALYDAAMKGLSLPAPVSGGPSRQASVLAGLRALNKADNAPDIVLIHDAARAFVSQDIIDRVIDAVIDGDEGAIPALPVSDSLKRGRAHVEETVERADLWRAQTPQGFPFAAILAAHEAHADKALTDDAAVAQAAGMRVRIVEGDERNIKITRPEDFAAVNSEEHMITPDIRTGFGYDVHQFEAGDAVTLCGVEIPFEQKLKGHSDADAGLHAITDALLGAIAAGDIGDHFPPSDPQWKDAASDVFLRHAMGLVRRQGGEILNVDVTLICEAPKIAPHRAKMRARVAEILDIELERVSVKATTSEKLGFTGRGEGLAAQAVATVALKGQDK